MLEQQKESVTPFVRIAIGFESVVDFSFTPLIRLFYEPWSWRQIDPPTMALRMIEPWSLLDKSVSMNPIFNERWSWWEVPVASSFDTEHTEPWSS